MKQDSNVLACSIDLKYYELLQLNFCCFLSVTLAISTLDKQSCFYYNICGISAERWFGNIIIIIIIITDSLQAL